MKSQPYKVRVSDDTALMELVFFRADADYLTEHSAARDRGGVLSGRIERFKDRLQMAHPDYVVAPEEAARLPLHEPVYGLTEGLTAKADGQGGARRAGEGAGDAGMAGRGLPETAQAWRRSTRRWTTAHAPVHDSDLSPDTPARQRLAYDELLANQLALLLIRAQLRGDQGPAHRRRRQAEGQGHRRPALCPDRSAAGALAEIEEDMASEQAHAAAAAGRCRLGQDHRRVAGPAERGGSGLAGRADGADRNSGAPASGLAGALCRGGRACGWPA